MEAFFFSLGWMEGKVTEVIKIILFPWVGSFYAPNWVSIKEFSSLPIHYTSMHSVSVKVLNHKVFNFPLSIVVNCMFASTFFEASIILTLRVPRLGFWLEAYTKISKENYWMMIEKQVFDDCTHCWMLKIRYIAFPCF